MKEKERIRQERIRYVTARIRMNTAMITKRDVLKTAAKMAAPNKLSRDLKNDGDRNRLIISLPISKE